MKKEQILFEISINNMFDNMSQKISSKKIIPKRQGADYFETKKVKSSFLGGLFGSNYNIKNKLVSTIVFRSENQILSSSTNSCEVLLCKFKNQDLLFLPILNITISKSGSNDKELIDNLLSYCSHVFPYFFDVEYQTCCKNKFLRTEDNKLFIFPFSDSEWSGNPQKPRSPVSNDIEELVWVDVVRMLEDQTYAKQYLLSESTVKVLSWFLGMFK